MTVNSDQQRTWAHLTDDVSNYYVQASDSEREIMRSWVRGILLERTANITFVKADGSERTMPCTLQETVVPKSTKTSASDRKYNPDVCVVFDPDRQVWRSFRWDRMKRIEFTLG